VLTISVAASMIFPKKEDSSWDASRA